MTWEEVVPALLITLVGGLFAWQIAGWWRRRRGLQEFARARGWSWVGMVAPDFRDPFSRFETLRWAVLLNNVMEGQHDGFDVIVFDYSKKNVGMRTNALVRLPENPPEFGMLKSDEGVKPADYASSTAAVPRLKAALGAQTKPFIVQTGVFTLLVQRVARLQARDLPDFLAVAASLARAVVEDVRAVSPPAPPPAHPPRG